MSRFGVLAFLTIILTASASSSQKQSCDKDTGGTCKYGLCFAWRNAECNSEQKCVCPEGSCNVDGECVKTGECAKNTGGGCITSDCFTWRSAECSELAHFPSPCLSKAIFSGIYIAIGFLTCCFSINCYFATCACMACKKKCGIACTGGLSFILTVFAIGVTAKGLMGIHGVTQTCVAVGLVDQAGFHLPDGTTGDDDDSDDNDGMKKGMKSSFLPSSIEAKQCICAGDACAVHGECVTNGCRKFTGGTCSMFGCDASRNAECHYEEGDEKRCMCGAGKCAHHGKCHAEEELVKMGVLGNVSSLNAIGQSPRTRPRTVARTFASLVSFGTFSEFLAAFLGTGMMMTVAFFLVRHFRSRNELGERLLKPEVFE